MSSIEWIFILFDIQMILLIVKLIGLEFLRIRLLSVLLDHLFIRLTRRHVVSFLARSLGLHIQF